MQQEYKKLQLETDSYDLLFHQIASRTLLDFGIIEYVDKQGRARVRSNRIIGTEFQRYIAEIVAPGGIDGITHCVTPGQACLLITPCTPMSSLKEHFLDETAELYSPAWVKCIPIGYYDPNQTVQASYLPGTFTLGTSKVVFRMTEDTVVLEGDKFNVALSSEGHIAFDVADKQTSVEIDEEGNVSVGAGYVYDEENGVWNWSSLIEQKSDGSLSLQAAAVVNEDTHESYGQVQASISAEGSVELKTGVDEEGNQKSLLSVDTEGNVEVGVWKEGKQETGLKLGNDGTVTVTSMEDDEMKAQITLSSDGSLLAETADGNTFTLSSDGCTIQDANGNKVELGSGGVVIQDAKGGKVEMAGSITIQGTSGKVEIM